MDFYFEHVLLPKMRPVWRIISYPVLAFVISLIVGMVWLFGEAAVYGGAVGVVAVRHQLLMVLVTFTLTVVVLWFMQRKEWAEANFWDTSVISARTVIVCILFGVVLSFFWGGFTHLSGLPLPFPAYSHLFEPLSGSNAVLQVLGIAIIPPIFNQVLYRGIVLRRLMETSSCFHRANIIHALVVAVFRFDVMQGAYAFVLALIFGLVYAKFKTIWAPIVVHVLFNLLPLIMFNVWDDFYAGMTETVVIAITVVSAVLAGLFIFTMRKIDVANDEKPLG